LFFFYLSTIQNYLNKNLYKIIHFNIKKHFKLDKYSFLSGSVFIIYKE
jgi:hypothetical protein